MQNIFHYSEKGSPVEIQECFKSILNSFAKLRGISQHLVANDSVLQNSVTTAVEAKS